MLTLSLGQEAVPAGLSGAGCQLSGAVPCSVLHPGGLPFKSCCGQPSLSASVGC